MDAQIDLAVEQAIATRNATRDQLATGAALVVEVTTARRSLLDGEVREDLKTQTLWVRTTPSPCISSVPETIEGERTGTERVPRVTSDAVVDLLTWPIFYLENQEALTDGSIQLESGRLIVSLPDDVWTSEELTPQKGATTASLYIADLEAPVTLRREVRLAVDGLDGEEVLTAVDADGMEVLVDSTALRSLDRTIEPETLTGCPL